MKEPPYCIVGTDALLVPPHARMTVKTGGMEISLRPYRLILPPNIGLWFTVSGGTFGGKEIPSLKGEILAFALAPDVAPQELYCHDGRPGDELTLSVTNIDDHASHVFRAVFILRVL